MFKKKILYLTLVLAMLVSMIPIAGAVETPEAAFEPALAETAANPENPSPPRPGRPAGDNPRADRLQGQEQLARQSARQDLLREAQMSAQAAPKRPEPEPAEFLVTIQAEGDRFAQAQAAHELEPTLAWMQQTGQIDAFEYLPGPNAFRVEAKGNLAALQEVPAVSAVQPYSLEALQTAIAAPVAGDRALAMAESAPLATGDIWVQLWLYDNSGNVNSIANTNVVISLTTATGDLKNEPGNTSFSWWGFDGTYYNGNFNLYDANSNWVPMEPGDILIVDQVGQAMFTY